MLLSVNQVSKLFSADVVLDGVSFRLERREKVALVGRNGSGKTTLLKILIGEYEPDGGNILLERGASLGYLSQHSLALPDRTVLEVATEARSHLLEMQRRMEAFEALTNPTADDLDEYALLQEHFHAQGGYSVESDLKVVLKRLGFEEDEWNKPVRALSGGEKTRLALAKLLLEEPELLILDEPTNHLDIEAIEWLESWVKGYGGAVIVVSHDRQFLNAVSQRVLELRDGKIRSFDGPFDRYVQLAREEDERIAEIAAKQAGEMAKLDEFVRRFMNSQRTAQARGRLKMLEKMKAQKVVVRKDDKGMAAGFAKVKRAGDIVLETKGVSKAFGSQVLFSKVDWLVRWGERWGVIGPNGAGKSTLVKIALDRLEPDEGTRRLGSNVELGWFAQDAEFLDLNDTPLEAVMDATGFEIGPARSLLGRFLVSGDDAFRPIRTMSGGERVKVALACLTGMNPNVLVLDEPTNHLDLDSCDALAQVLREYTGTVILISHDRWLLEQVAGSILEIKPGGVTSYEGTYEEFKRRGTTPAVPMAKTKEAPAPSVPLLSQREISKEIGRLGKEISRLEEEIESGENELLGLERRMSNPIGEDVVALSNKYGETQSRIEGLLAAWTEAGTQLEEFKKMQGAEIGVSFRST